MKRATVRNLCLGAAALVGLMLILPKQAPRDPVDDPAAYLRAKLPETDLRDWMAPYLDWSPEFLDKVVANFVTKEEKIIRGKLPHDPRKLDQLLSSKLPSFFVNASTATPEMREQVLERARARFADPPIVMVKHEGGSYATIDFWVVPGVWKRPMRASSDDDLEIRADGIAFDGLTMKPEFFRDSLQKVSARFPDANAYDIRARIPEGRSSSLVRFVYYPKANSFERDDGGPREFAKGPEGGFKSLLDGSSSIADLKFYTVKQGEESPRHTLPPAREPLVK